MRESVEASLACRAVYSLRARRAKLERARLVVAVDAKMRWIADQYKPIEGQDCAPDAQLIAEPDENVASCSTTPSETRRSRSLEEPIDTAIHLSEDDRAGARKP